MYVTPHGDVDCFVNGKFVLARTHRSGLEGPFVKSIASFSVDNRRKYVIKIVIFFFFFLRNSIRQLPQSDTVSSALITITALFTFTLIAYKYELVLIF